MFMGIRKALLSAICLCIWSGFAGAEPLAFEQAANVTGKGGVEIGANFDYAYTRLENPGIGSTFNQTYLDIPVFIRLGISALEAQVTVPYGMVRNNYNALIQDQNSTGWENTEFLLKSNFIQLPFFNFAIGLNTLFPTGYVSHDLDNGLNLTPFVAADIDLIMVRLHGNLGYQFSGQHNTTTDPVTHQNISETTFRPGNATYWALGLEFPLGSDLVSFNAELLGTKYGPAQFNGSDLESSPGTTLSFVPGFQFLALPFKAKLGLELPLERRSDRPEVLPRGDWRVLGGVSLQFSMGGPNPKNETETPAQ
ncbi:MAG: hypothetical protein HGA76_05900 [Candidatus Firestonebacteria bacterium]|nr:hypothetical protein [Candidatus Firestonebacteria bacterium]